MNHHHPMLAEYYTVVLSYSAVILICIAFFILFLFKGLNSKDALVVDAKPAAPASHGNHDTPLSHH